MFFYVKTLFYIDALLLLGLIGFRAALRAPYKNIVQARTIGVVLFTPVVALFCGNIYIFYGYLFAVAAFTSRSKSDVGALYMLMISLCPALGMHLSVGGVYLFFFSSTHAINLGALLGLFIARGKLRRGNITLDMLIWIPVILVSLTTLPDMLITTILRILIDNSITIVVPYYIVSRSIEDETKLNRVLLYFLLGAILASAIAIFEVVRSWPLYQPYQNALHLPLSMSKTLGVRGGHLRVPGPMLDYTSLGLFLSAALSAAPYLRRNFTARSWYGIFGALLLALLATQSRGAWVGAAAGLAFTMIARGRIALVVAGAAAGGLAWAARSLISGSGGDAAASQTAQYRIDLLKAGYRQFLDHPLLGQGRQQLEAHLSDLIQGQHIIDFVNSHLHIALVSGSVGLVFWLAMWLTPGMMAWKAARVTRRAVPDSPALLPAAILVTMFVGLTFTSMVDRNLTWAMLAIALVVPCASAARRAAAGRAAGQRAGTGAAWPAMPGGGKLPRPAILLPR